MEQTGNSFTEGLNKDITSFATPNNVLTDALNATLITFNGNEMMLLNDMGNTNLTYYPRTWESITEGENKDEDYKHITSKISEKVKLKDGFIPIGVKEHGDIIYIVSYNPANKRTEIGSFPGPEFRPFDKEPKLDILTEDKVVDINSIKSLDKIYPITLFKNFTDDDAFLKARDKINLHYETKHFIENIFQNDSLISTKESRKLFKTKILNTEKNIDITDLIDLNLEPTVDENGNPIYINKEIFYPNVAKGNLGLQFELETIDDFYLFGYPEVEVKDILDYNSENESKGIKEDHICVKLSKLQIRNLAKYLKINNLNFDIYVKNYEGVIQNLDVNGHPKEHFKPELSESIITELKTAEDKDISLDFISTDTKKTKEGTTENLGIVIPLVENANKEKVLSRQLILYIDITPITDTKIGGDSIDLSKDYSINIVYDLSKSIDQLMGEQFLEKNTDVISRSVGNFTLEGKAFKDIPYKDIIENLYGDISNKTQDVSVAINNETYLENIHNLTNTLEPSKLLYTSKYVVTLLSYANKESDHLTLKFSDTYSSVKALDSLKLNFPTTVDGINWNCAIFPSKREGYNGSEYLLTVYNTSTIELTKSNINELSNFKINYIYKLGKDNTLEIVKMGGACLDETSDPTGARTNVSYARIVKPKRDENNSQYTTKFEEIKSVNASIIHDPAKAEIHLSDNQLAGIVWSNLGNVKDPCKKTINPTTKEVLNTLLSNEVIYHSYAKISRADKGASYRQDYAAGAILEGDKKDIGDGLLHFEYVFDNSDSSYLLDFEEVQIPIEYTISKGYKEGQTLFTNKFGSFTIGGDELLQLDSYDEVDLTKTSSKSSDARPDLVLNFYNTKKVYLMPENNDKFIVKLPNQVWTIFACYIKGEVKISSTDKFYYHRYNDKLLESKDICLLDKDNYTKSVSLGKSREQFRVVILTRTNLTIEPKSSAAIQPGGNLKPQAKAIGIPGSIFDLVKFKNDASIYNPITYIPNIYINLKDANPKLTEDNYVEVQDIDTMTNFNSAGNVKYYCGNFTGPAIKNVKINDLDETSYYVKNLTGDILEAERNWFPLPFYDY